jgi:hypothetical protein
LGGGVAIEDEEEEEEEDDDDETCSSSSSLSSSDPSSSNSGTLNFSSSSSFPPYFDGVPPFFDGVPPPLLGVDGVTIEVFKSSEACFFCALDLVGVDGGLSFIRKLSRVGRRKERRNREGRDGRVRVRVRVGCVGGGGVADEGSGGLVCGVWCLEKTWIFILHFEHHPKLNLNDVLYELKIVAHQVHNMIEGWWVLV